MKISFEGQTISKNNMTGIGCYALNIIKKALELGSENTYSINVFDFLGRNDSMSNIKNALGSTGTTVRLCSLMPYGLFARYQSIFGKIPYESYFNERADITHFFNFIIPEKIRSKTVTTVHDMVYMLYPETMNSVNHSIFRKNLFRSCKEADAIVTVSQNSRREIAGLMKVPKEKIFVTYNAVDKSIYYPRKDNELIKRKYGIDTPYILYLGTLEPRKNIPALIRAFLAVSEKFDGLKLVIAGGRGWKSEIIFNLVKELKLEDRVVFTGYVAEEDKPALYSCAEIFVFPSFYEGFGIPPLEAMACGTPVISSNAASLPEVVADAGILVNPCDEEELANEMAGLLYDSGRRGELSIKGIERSLKFTWEDSARKVLDIYRAL